jgi:hypothetical protein
MSFQPFAYDWDRRAAFPHEQWKWLAVEIAEIRRCAAVGDEAHDRLALLLTDHLVEVIIGREVNARLGWQPADSVIEELRRDRDSGLELPATLAKVVDEHVGPEQRQKLDQHLHEKTRYLVKHGVLTPEERVVLKRMHEYRNDAYHRETLDADLISDLVLAYMMLASQLLARHRPMLWTISTSDPNVTVVTPGELPGLLTDGLAIDLKGMAGRFIDHVVKRVGNIRRWVGVARVLLHVVTEDAQQRGGPPPEDDFARLLRTLNNVSPAQLESWAKRASNLKTNIKSLVNLMLRYISLGQQLCAIDPSAKRLEIIADKWEQDHLDKTGASRTRRLRRLSDEVGNPRTAVPGGHAVGQIQPDRLGDEDVAGEGTVSGTHVPPTRSMGGKRPG